LERPKDVEEMTAPTNRFQGARHKVAAPPNRYIRQENMKTQSLELSGVDAYIATFPKDRCAILEKIRNTIRKAAPDAKEIINYQIPTYFLEGNLVHFAAFKKHIGFYPTPTGIEKFKAQLARYESAKGSVKFPLDKPIPYGLIAEIVAFRVQENLERANRRNAR
jgi:uncharacterized protein YdhG (YjbR/CyaY superfamily)